MNDSAQQSACTAPDWTSVDLSDAQLARYSRHILLDAVDLTGQARLLSAHMLVVGCGGLGSAAIPILAASGVGRLTIIDADTIELSNLQRQVSYRTADVGQSKSMTIAKVIEQLNPDVRVRVVNERIGLSELVQLCWKPPVDVMLDCTDNFATRHAVNRAAAQMKIPLVSGSAVRFDGQIALYDARVVHSPCYACAFPEHNESVSDGACAMLGIFSPLVGVIGTMQASLALRVVLGLADSSIGQLQTYDALNGEWLSFGLSKNSECPVCGAHTD